MGLVPAGEGGALVPFAWSIVFECLQVINQVLQEELDNA